MNANSFRVNPRPFWRSLRSKSCFCFAPDQGGPVAAAGGAENAAGVAMKWSES
jgi:hypothetical protein